MVKELWEYNNGWLIVGGGWWKIIGGWWYIVDGDIMCIGGLVSVLMVWIGGVIWIKGICGLMCKRGVFVL